MVKTKSNRVIAYYIIRNNPNQEYKQIEIRIVRVLYYRKRGLTIYEIAKEIGSTYPTTKNYVDDLVKENILIESKKETDKAKIKIYHLNAELYRKIDEFQVESSTKEEDTETDIDMN